MPETVVVVSLEELLELWGPERCGPPVLPYLLSQN